MNYQNAWYNVPFFGLFELRSLLHLAPALLCIIASRRPTSCISRILQVALIFVQQTEDLDTVWKVKGKEKAGYLTCTFSISCGVPLSGCYSAYGFSFPCLLWFKFLLVESMLHGI